LYFYFVILYVYIILTYEYAGQGASGVVYSATDKRDGRKVALKIAPSNELTELTNEIGLQSLSKHPNIVEFIEAYAFEVGD